MHPAHLLHHLKNFQSPQPRPYALLTVLFFLLINTALYFTLVASNDYPIEYTPNLTPDGQAILQKIRFNHGIFITIFLLSGIYVLARGWRFSRRSWLLILLFVLLGDFWQFVLQVLNSFEGAMPEAQQYAVKQYFLILSGFCLISPFLFLPSINRWRRKVHQNNQ